MTEVLPKHPDRRLDRVFSAQALAKGGVIRRSVVWVNHEIARQRFIAAVRLRGFHLLEGGGGSSS
ncbi:N-(5'-phosphoribosyl)anthranilate isomerase [Antarctobacter sp.]|uniref:N-(5'-phosphoribosyl)anthranilate isomerase n=1 Tax=Antarctobacter sp. TaxID=1872577 RepID=UPI002B26CB2F|nr:N-(5'-phosphoribosyl)anthranilate isomerase [Antarctobacter sp.]